jgi:hypothetical protein
MWVEKKRRMVQPFEHLKQSRHVVFVITTSRSVLEEVKYGEMVPANDRNDTP